MSDKKAYYRTLPQKRMGSGALFWDEYGRILLVHPTYKPGWEIPGGIVEALESPKSCCQREVREELGLDVEIGRLLLIEYNEETAEKTESLMFVFAGKQLSPVEIDQIQLPQEELDQAIFFPPDELPQGMSVALRRRVLAAWDRLQSGQDVYMEEKL